MNCTQCRENFTAFDSKQLTDVLRGNMQEHLQSCDACQHELVLTREMFQLLDQQEPASVLAQSKFQNALKQHSLASAQATPNKGLLALFLRYWPSRPLWASAYSIALVFTGVIGGQLLPGISNSQQAALLDEQNNINALTCPVHSSASLWLPAKQVTTLT